MNIAVLGTGSVGRTLAGKLASLGHAVVLGTRDPEATLARSDGASPLPAWLAQHPTVRLATLAAAAAGADLVVNATNGRSTLAALAAAGAGNLDGKVLVDVSNPLDFSGGMPPRLFVCNDDSLGEQIQRAFPRAKVVKTLNTVNASLMVAPGQLRGGAHTVFVSGDDADAKRQVAALLRDGFGWTDVIDLGGIETSRGTEMVLALWARIFGATGNPNFAFGVVR
jgi:predicted dinucleotide-binding enzyme